MDVKKINQIAQLAERILGVTQNNDANRCTTQFITIIVS